MSQAVAQLSPFGQQLRMWRRQRGLSQLALAIAAETTPRHVSFIETGRSRPGRELVLRLAQCLDLPVRDRNTLLVAAGLTPAFAERDLNGEEAQPYRMAIETILQRHDPYPACAMNLLGKVLMANATFRAFSPGFEDMTPEQSLDAFFAPGPLQQGIENWAELAWAWVDRQRHAVARTNNARLAALVERALRHLADVPRPPMTLLDGPAALCPRLRVGDQVIRTFVTVMRFEDMHDVTLSELRIELVFPLDAQGDAFFRSLTDCER